MTPMQCRSGRAMAGLSQEALAVRSGITRKSLHLFEASARVMHPNNLRVVRAALEEAGVEFIDGERPGVRMAVEFAA